MKIAIFGATGGVGGRAVEQALERGYEVTAFAREPSAVKIAHERLTVVKGDCFDADSVERAVAGQAAVVSCIGSRNYVPGDRVASVGTQNIIDAMRRQAVARLIALSSVGLGTWRENALFVDLFVRSAFHLFYREIVADLELMEEEIKASGLDWTIVRPSFLTNGPRTGVYHVATDTRDARPYISRADVADFMIGCLESPDYVRQIPSIGYKILGIY
ncbi:MAG: SDR family oxidoreductase [Acidobacteria bacterium]|nr:SDR family oxidoreductase [Acidobacteriota bacterium]